MSRISRLDRSQVTPEIATLFDKVFAQRGNVPNMFRVMAHRPEIFATMQAHFAAVLNTGTVSTKLKELIIVRTSQVNETPYCLASHTILARNLGWTDDQLVAPRRLAQRDDFTPAEKAALRLAETVTRDAHAVTDEQFAELRSFYSEGEIVELLCAIGLFNYFNRFNNALQMEPTRPGEGGRAPPDRRRTVAAPLTHNPMTEELIQPHETGIARGRLSAPTSSTATAPSSIPCPSTTSPGRKLSASGTAPSRRSFSTPGADVPSPRSSPRSTRCTGLSMPVDAVAETQREPLSRTSSTTSRPFLKSSSTSTPSMASIPLAVVSGSRRKFRRQLAHLARPARQVRHPRLCRRLRSAASPPPIASSSPRNVSAWLPKIALSLKTPRWAFRPRPPPEWPRSAYPCPLNAPDRSVRPAHV